MGRQELVREVGDHFWTWNQGEGPFINFHPRPIHKNSNSTMLRIRRREWTARSPSKTILLYAQMRCQSHDVSSRYRLQKGRLRNTKFRAMGKQTQKSKSSAQPSNTTWWRRKYQLSPKFCRNQLKALQCLLRRRHHHHYLRRRQLSLLPMRFHRRRSFQWYSLLRWSPVRLRLVR